MIAPQEELAKFFEFMWGDINGFVYLPTKSSTHAWKKKMYEWPAHKDFIIQHVISSSAAGLDVYFSPALFKEAGNVQKENIKGSNVLWCEFDGKAPADWTTPPIDHASEDHSPSQEGVPGPPSLVVQSSTEDRQHVYWKLDEFTGDLDFIESSNRAIAYRYGSDASGWDGNQVLRPPRTRNYKRDLPVLLSTVSGLVYKAEQFTHFPRIKDLVRDSILDNDIPDALGIIGKYTWGADTLELVRKQVVPDGQRSSAMMRIGYHCAELGMEASEIYSILLYVDDKWEKYKFRNDRKARLLEIVNKAKTKYPHKIEEEFAGLLSTVEPVETGTRLVWGFKDILAAEFKVNWIVKNLITDHGFGLVTGLPNVGKTQFALQLGMRTSIGQNFLHWESMRPHKIMMLSLEMWAAELKLFLATMARGFSEAELELLQEYFHVMPLGNPIPITSPEGRAFIESQIEEHAPQGLIIDSLQKIHLDSLVDDDKVRQTNRYLNALRNKYGVYITVIHHNRKAQGDNKRPKELSDVYGSQFITADVDYVIGLWEDEPVKEPGKISVSNLKNRLGKKKSPFFVQRTDELGFALVSQNPEMGALDAEAELVRRAKSNTSPRFQI